MFAPDPPRVCLLIGSTSSCISGIQADHMDNSPEPALPAEAQPQLRPAPQTTHQDTQIMYSARALKSGRLGSCTG